MDADWRCFLCGVLCSWHWKKREKEGAGDLGCGMGVACLKKRVVVLFSSLLLSRLLLPLPLNERNQYSIDEIDIN